MNNRLKKWLIVAVVILTCVGLDQLTKFIAISNLKEMESIIVIDNFFYWTLCYNPGGAWSIFSDNTGLLIAVSILALGLIMYTIYKSKNTLYNVAASVFTGGLLGNLIDRIAQSEVTDFIDFLIFGYDFPVFNVADIFICVSAVFIILAIFKEEKENEQQSSK